MGMGGVEESKVSLGQTPLVRCLLRWTQENETGSKAASAIERAAERERDGLVMAWTVERTKKRPT